MTNRQNEYVRLFKLENLLTPQMVIPALARTESLRDRLTDIRRAANAPRAN